MNTADRIASAQLGLESTGKRLFIAYLKGEEITRKEGMAAKCFDCMGGYADGRKDCRVPHCPLYPWMPYNPNRKAAVSSRDAKTEGESDSEGIETLEAPEAAETPPTANPDTPQNT